jgi:RNA polymerase sigma factor (sigma-70 family)
VNAPSFHTAQLHAWLGRMRDGDTAARDELLRRVCGRLERLARKMLRGFPNVARWEQTGDVLQNALLRLLHSLQKIEPVSTASFFNLAAEHIRRELLDLARHYHGPWGQAAHHESGHDLHSPAHEPADRAGEPDDFERWCAFHQEVERLPAAEREVVGLLFYHGWPQTQVAELFGVTERTVRRRWESALLRLSRTLGQRPC